MLGKRNQSYLHQLFKKKLYEASGPAFGQFCTELFTLAWPSFLPCNSENPIKQAGSTGYYPEDAACFRFFIPSDSAMEDPYAEAVDLMIADCTGLESSFPGCDPIHHYIFCINTRQRKSIPAPLEEAAQALRHQLNERSCSLSVYTAQALRDFFWSDVLTDTQRISFLGDPELYEEAETLESPAVRPEQTDLKLTAPLPRLSQDFLSQSREEEFRKLNDLLKTNQPVWLSGPSGIGLRSLAIAYGRQAEAAGIPVYWITYRDSLEHTLLSLPLEGYCWHHHPGETELEATERRITELLLKLSPLLEHALLIISEIPGTCAELAQNTGHPIGAGFRALPGEKLLLTRDMPAEPEQVLCVGPLSNAHQKQLLAQYYEVPDSLSEFEKKQKEHQISDLLHVLKGHTLSLKLAGQLLAASKEELTLPELLKRLAEDSNVSQKDPIRRNLQLLCQCFDFPSSEQEILFHASCFGPEGLDQGLFYAAEEDHNKGSLLKLTAGDWLTASGDGNLMLHPCISDISRTLHPRTEEIGGFLHSVLEFFRKIHRSQARKKTQTNPDRIDDFLDRLYEQITKELTRNETLSRKTLLGAADLYASTILRDCTSDATTCCFRAAYLYYLAGDYTEAAGYQNRAVLSMTEGAAEQNPEPYLYQLYYQIKSGDYHKAVSLVQALLPLKSGWALETQLFLLELACTAAWETGNIDLLAHCAEERSSYLAGADPDQISIRDLLTGQLDLACSKLISGHTDAAAVCFEELLHDLDQLVLLIDPKDPSAILWHPQAGIPLPAFLSSDQTMGYRTEQILKKHLPERSLYELFPALSRGLTALDHQDYSSALEALQFCSDRLKQQGRQDHSFHYLLLADLGWLYGVLSRPERGIAALEELLTALDAQNPEYAVRFQIYAFYQLGFLYRTMGDYVNAGHYLASYEDLTNPPTPVELDDPNDPPLLLRRADDICFVLGSVYCSSGEYDKAIEFLSLALETGNLSAYYWLGIAYTSTWQYNQAIMTFQEGLELAEADQVPDSKKLTDTAWLYSGYGYTLCVSERDVELGLSLVQKAHQIFTAQFEADSTTLALSFYRVGLAYAACDRKEEARKEFDQALQILENNPEYKTMYAAWIREIRDTRIRFY